MVDYTEVKKAKFWYGGVDIGDITAWSPGSSPHNKLDISDWASDPVEYRLTKGDLPEDTFDLNLNPDSTGQTLLETDLGKNLNKICKIEFAEGTQRFINWTGNVMNFTFGAAKDGIYTGSVTILAASKKIRGTS